MDLPPLIPEYNILGASVNATMRIAQGETCKKFNDMMKQFLRALEKAFGNVEVIALKIKIQKEIIEQLIERDPKFVLIQFKDSAEPHMMQNSPRDVFMVELLPKIGVFRGFGIHEYWNQTPEKTRKTVWKYIRHLWSFCQQYEQFGDQKGIHAQAMEIIQSGKFEEFMKQTLNSLPDFSHQNAREEPPEMG